MSRYPILLFDADGTLYDFDRAEEAALTATLAAHDLPCDAESIELYRTLNRRLWAAFEAGEISKARLLASRFPHFLSAVGRTGDGDALNAEYLHRLGEGSFLLPGAETLCKQLALTHRLYIVTNGVAAVQRSRIARSPLRNCFRDIFISDELGYQKPQREFFTLVMDRIPDFRADAALVIGDSLSSDILGANNAGLDCCWYNPTAASCPGDVAVSYEIRQLEELLELV